MFVTSASNDLVGTKEQRIRITYYKDLLEVKPYTIA